MTIRAIRQYPRLEAFKTLKDAEVYLRKLLVSLQEEAVIVSTLYRTFIEGIKTGDEFNVIEILDELPVVGNAGRLVYLTTDDKLYLDDGSAWVVLIVPASVYLHIGGDGEVQIVAGQIAANAVTVNKLTTGLSPNLLRAKYTDFQSFENGDTIGAPYLATVICDTSDFYIGDRCQKLTVTGDTYGSIFLGSTTTDYNLRLKPSTKYIVSFYAKASSGTPNVKARIRQDDAVYKYWASTQAITTSWARYEGVVETDANLTNSGVVRLDAFVTDTVVWFDAIQVEEASAATSPEATPYKPSGIVEIHGGQIEADTITADQIDAGTITADEIHAGTITADNLVAGLVSYWYSVASTTTRNSNDAEKDTSSQTPTYVKIKETKLNEVTGVMRIYFELKAAEGLGMVYARIYKNGVALGTIRSRTQTSYYGYTEDLGGFAADDLIQIYACGSSGESAYVRNFRFQYDRAVSIVAGETLTTPLTTVDQTAFPVTNQDP